MDARTKKILIISAAGLIALRIFSLFLIPYFPHLDQYRISNIGGMEQHWYSQYFSAIHEGDNTEYFRMAGMIYNFDFKKLNRTFGFPALIIPFIFIFGNNFSDVFFPLIFFNGIILFSLSIILIIWSSFLIFKKIAPAVFSGFLFLIFPFIFYALRSYGPQFSVATWNDINFMNMNWLAAMADQPAAFFSLLVLFLLLLAERKRAGLFFYSVIGFLAGFSAMIRISNVVIAAVGAFIIFIYEMDKKYKKVFFYCLFSILGFLPQFIYNFIFFGSPISFGYQKEDYADWVEIGAAKGPMWSFGNFFHIIERAVDYSVFAIPVFLALFALILAGILYIGKINKRQALVVSFWFILPTLFYMFFATGTTTMRYYLPAVPPFIFLSVAALCAVCGRIRPIFFPNLPNQKI